MSWKITSFPLTNRLFSVFYCHRNYEIVDVWFDPFETIQCFNEKLHLFLSIHVTYFELVKVRLKYKRTRKEMSVRFGVNNESFRWKDKYCRLSTKETLKWLIKKVTNKLALRNQTKLWSNRIQENNYSCVHSANSE